MTSCPHCGKDITHPASNCNPGLTLQVPEPMISALVDALAIGRNAAMMSREPENQDGLQALLDIVEAALPPLAEKLRDGQYAALCARISQGHEIAFEVGHKGTWYKTNFHVRMIDKTGAAWAKPAGLEMTVMTSREVDSEEAAEALKLQLEDLRDRYSPL